MPKRVTRSTGDLPEISSDLRNKEVDKGKSKPGNPSNTGTGGTGAGSSADGLQKQVPKTTQTNIEKIGDQVIAGNKERDRKSRNHHRREAKKHAKKSKRRSSSSSSSYSSSTSSSSDDSNKKKYRKKYKKRARANSLTSSSNSEDDDYKKIKRIYKKKVSHPQNYENDSSVPDNTSFGTSKRTSRRLRDAERRLAIIETHIFGAPNPSSINNSYVPGQDNTLRLQRNYYCAQNYRSQLPGQRFQNAEHSHALPTPPVSTAATSPVMIPVHTYRQIQVSTSNPSAHPSNLQLNTGNSGFLNPINPRYGS